MQRRNAAIIAIVIVAVAVCAAVPFVFDDDGDDGDFRQYYPDAITDEMRDRPSVDEMSGSLGALRDAFAEVATAAGSTQDDITDALWDYYDLYCWYIAQQAVLTWDYYTDPATYGEEHVGWGSALTEMSNEMDEVMREGLDGPNRDAVGSAIVSVLGEEKLGSLESTESMTQEELDLRQRESELVVSYNLAETPEEMADIYLELINVRNSLAGIWGYDTYADYAYSEVYGRDYTPEDAAELWDLVREYAVPLIADMSAAGSITVSYEYGGTDELYADASPFFHSISEEFGDFYDYMLENGLIDFRDLDTKVDAGFTSTVIAGDYKILFIYDRPYDGYQDIETLVHEFGHSADAGLNPTETSDFDIAEVQSQGLEALFSVSDLNPVEGDVEAMYVKSMLASIALGCVNDEFQQRAYLSDADSLEDLDRIYEEVLAELGVTTTQHWYDVHHNFTQPFYYISYAVSAFSSLGIFVDALSDYDGAVEEYLTVNAYRETGYNRMTEDLGLANAFDEDDFADVVHALRDHLFVQTETFAATAVAAAEV